jgi:LmbE family N-acetylglucosaminyl deacetylase
MKILYIFPHPDDESFGPAHVMSKQRRDGHGVHLLTLTRGGATKQRFKYNHSIQKMGEVRYQEMRQVAEVLDLSGMTVLDLPDSGLKEMDPRDIEQAIISEIECVRPHVLVTYPVHGISGFHDHLVTHAVVKRVFVDLKAKSPYLKRLAFFTITEKAARQSEVYPLSGSTLAEIDCIEKVEEIDIANTQKALDCYRTFKEIVDKTGIKERIQKKAVFEIFQEQYRRPLTDLFAGIS